MGYSISDAVSEVLGELHPLEYAFKHGLVNYSALGRFIKPAVEKRMKGESVGLDAIIMAIRRNADVLEREAPADSADLYEILSECKLVLRTGMVNVHFDRSEELFAKLVKLEERIDWASGEKMYVLQRTDELSVISMSKYLPDLLELVPDGKQVLEKQENLALLTVSFPLAALYTPGFIEFLSHQFSALGVSILGVFSSYSKISFLFDEAEAASVYEKLTTSLKHSKEFAEQNGKK